MKLVVQRVKRCSVKANGTTVGSIQEGLFVLVGLHSSDTFEAVTPLLERLYRLKLHSKEDAKWSRSLKEDASLQLLLVSQFTLFARTGKGTRPDFHEAMAGELAKGLFEQVLQHARTALGEDRVATGAFGQWMEIDPILDGPVTIIID